MVTVHTDMRPLWTTGYSKPKQLVAPDLRYTLVGIAVTYKHPIGLKFVVIFFPTQPRSPKSIQSIAVATVACLLHSLHLAAVLALIVSSGILVTHLSTQYYIQPMQFRSGCD